MVNECLSFTIHHFRRHRNRNGPHLQYRECHHRHHRNLHHRVDRHCRLQYHQYQECRHHQYLCPHHLHLEHRLHHHRNPVLRLEQPQGIQPYSGRKDSVPVPTTSF